MEMECLYHLHGIVTVNFVNKNCNTSLLGKDTIVCKWLNKAVNILKMLNKII